MSNYSYLDIGLTSTHSNNLSCAANAFDIIDSSLKCSNTSDVIQSLNTRYEAKNLGCASK